MPQYHLTPDPNHRPHSRPTSATLQLGSVGLTEFCQQKIKTRLETTVPSWDPWSLELYLRVCSSRARVRDQTRFIHPREISVASWDLQSLACLLLESTPTGRSSFFFLAADLSNFPAGFLPCFSGSASPTNLDHWKRNCPLKGPLEPRAQSARLILESTRFATLWPSRL